MTPIPFLLFTIVSMIAKNSALEEINTAIALNAAKENPVLLKILQTVDAATSNERLFDVTLNIFKSLCICMRETLRKKQMEHFQLSREMQSVQIENDVKESNRKVLDIYQKIYNKTCFDLREELAMKVNNSGNVTPEEEKDFIDHSNCGKKAIDENTEDYERLTSQLTEIVESKSSLRKILRTTFVSTRNYHKFHMRKYNLFKNSQKSTPNSVKHSIIVILTFYPNQNGTQISDSSTDVSIAELNETLYSPSPIDIDVIDTRYGRQENSRYDDFIPKTATDCSLKSIYSFLLQSEQVNKTKVFKMLRKKGTIKVYIDIPTQINHVDYSKVCCNDDREPLCNVDFSRESFDSHEITTFLPEFKKRKKLRRNYKDTISKIKTLVKLYDRKLNGNKLNQANSKTNSDLKSLLSSNKINSESIESKDLMVNKMNLPINKDPFSHNSAKSQITVMIIDNEIEEKRMFTRKPNEINILKDFQMTKQYNNVFDNFDTFPKITSSTINDLKSSPLQTTETVLHFQLLQPESKENSPENSNTSDGLKATDSLSKSMTKRTVKNKKTGNKNTDNNYVSKEIRGGTDIMRINYNKKKTSKLLNKQYKHDVDTNIFETFVHRNVNINDTAHDIANIKAEIKEMSTYYPSINEHSLNTATPITTIGINDNVSKKISENTPNNSILSINWTEHLNSFKYDAAKRIKFGENEYFVTKEANRKNNTNLQITKRSKLESTKSITVSDDAPSSVKPYLTTKKRPKGLGVHKKENKTTVIEENSKDAREPSLHYKYKTHVVENTTKMIHLANNHYNTENNINLTLNKRLNSDQLSEGKEELNKTEIENNTSKFTLQNTKKRSSVNLITSIVEKMKKNSRNLRTTPRTTEIGYSDTTILDNITAAITRFKSTNSTQPHQNFVSFPLVGQQSQSSTEFSIYSGDVKSNAVVKEENYTFKATVTGLSNKEQLLLSQAFTAQPEVEKISIDMLTTTSRANITPELVKDNISMPLLQHIKSDSLSKTYKLNNTIKQQTKSAMSKNIGNKSVQEDFNISLTDIDLYSSKENKSRITRSPRATKNAIINNVKITSFNTTLPLRDILVVNLSTATVQDLDKPHSTKSSQSPQISNFFEFTPEKTESQISATVDLDFNKKHKDEMWIPRTEVYHGISKNDQKITTYIISPYSIKDIDSKNEMAKPNNFTDFAALNKVTDEYYDVQNINNYVKATLLKNPTYINKPYDLIIKEPQSTNKIDISELNYGKTHENVKEDYEIRYTVASRLTTNVPQSNSFGANNIALEAPHDVILKEKEVDKRLQPGRHIYDREVMSIVTDKYVENSLNSKFEEPFETQLLQSLQMFNFSVGQNNSKSSSFENTNNGIESEAPNSLEDINNDFKDILNFLNESSHTDQLSISKTHNLSTTDIQAKLMANLTIMQQQPASIINLKKKVKNTTVTGTQPKINHNTYFVTKEDFKTKNKHNISTDTKHKNKLNIKTHKFDEKVPDTTVKSATPKKFGKFEYIKPPIAPNWTFVPVSRTNVKQKNRTISPENKKNNDQVISNAITSSVVDYLKVMTPNLMKTEPTERISNDRDVPFELPKQSISAVEAVIAKVGTTKNYFSSVSKPEVWLKLQSKKLQQLKKLKATEDNKTNVTKLTGPNKDFTSFHIVDSLGSTGLDSEIANVANIGSTKNIGKSHNMQESKILHPYANVNITQLQNISIKMANNQLPCNIGDNKFEKAKANANVIINVRPEYLIVDAVTKREENEDSLKSTSIFDNYKTFDMINPTPFPDNVIAKSKDTLNVKEYNLTEEQTQFYTSSINPILFQLSFSKNITETKQNISNFVKPSTTMFPSSVFQLKNVTRNTSYTQATPNSGTARLEKVTKRNEIRTSANKSFHDKAENKKLKDPLNDLPLANFYKAHISSRMKAPEKTKSVDIEKDTSKSVLEITIEPTLYTTKTSETNKSNLIPFSGKPHFFRTTKILSAAVGKLDDIPIMSNVLNTSNSPKQRSIPKQYTVSKNYIETHPVNTAAPTKPVSLKNNYNTTSSHVKFYPVQIKNQINSEKISNTDTNKANALKYISPTENSKTRKENSDIINNVENIKKEMKYHLSTAKDNVRTIQYSISKNQTNSKSLSQIPNYFKNTLSYTEGNFEDSYVMSNLKKSSIISNEQHADVFDELALNKSVSNSEDIFMKTHSVNSTSSRNRPQITEDISYIHNMLNTNDITVGYLTDDDLRETLYKEPIIISTDRPATSSAMESIELTNNFDFNSGISDNYLDITEVPNFDAILTGTVLRTRHYYLKDKVRLMTTPEESNFFTKTSESAPYFKITDGNNINLSNDVKTSVSSPKNLKVSNHHSPEHQKLTQTTTITILRGPDGYQNPVSSRTESQFDIFNSDLEITEMPSFNATLISKVPKTQYQNLLKDEVLTTSGENHFSQTIENSTFMDYRQNETISFSNQLHLSEDQKRTQSVNKRTTREDVSMTDIFEDQITEAPSFNDIIPVEVSKNTHRNILENITPSTTPEKYFFIQTTENSTSIENRYDDNITLSNNVKTSHFPDAQNTIHDFKVAKLPLSKYQNGTQNTIESTLRYQNIQSSDDFKSVIFRGYLEKPEAHNFDVKYTDVFPKVRSHEVLEKETELTPNESQVLTQTTEKLSFNKKRYSDKVTIFNNEEKSDYSITEDAATQNTIKGSLKYQDKDMTYKYNKPKQTTALNKIVETSYTIVGKLSRSETDKHTSKYSFTKDVYDSQTEYEPLETGSNFNTRFNITNEPLMIRMEFNYNETKTGSIAKNLMSEKNKLSGYYTEVVTPTATLMVIKSKTNQDKYHHLKTIRKEETYNLPNSVFEEKQKDVFATSNFTTIEKLIVNDMDKKETSRELFNPLSVTDFIEVETRKDLEETVETNIDDEQRNETDNYFNKPEKPTTGRILNVFVLPNLSPEVYKSSSRIVESARQRKHPKYFKNITFTTVPYNFLTEKIWGLKKDELGFSTPKTSSFLKSNYTDTVSNAVTESPVHSLIRHSIPTDTIIPSNDKLVRVAESTIQSKHPKHYKNIRFTTVPIHFLAEKTISFKENKGDEPSLNPTKTSSFLKSNYTDKASSTVTESLFDVLTHHDDHQISSTDKIVPLNDTLTLLKENKENLYTGITNEIWVHNPTQNEIDTSSLSNTLQITELDKSHTVKPGPAKIYNDSDITDRHITSRPSLYKTKKIETTSNNFEFFDSYDHFVDDLNILDAPNFDSMTQIKRPQTKTHSKIYNKNEISNKMRTVTSPLETELLENKIIELEKEENFKIIKQSNVTKKPDSALNFLTEIAQERVSTTSDFYVTSKNITSEYDWNLNTMQSTRINEPLKMHKYESLYSWLTLKPSSFIDNSKSNINHSYNLYSEKTTNQFLKVENVSNAFHNTATQVGDDGIFLSLSKPTLSIANKTTTVGGLVTQKKYKKKTIFNESIIPATTEIFTSKADKTTSINNERIIELLNKIKGSYYNDLNYPNELRQNAETQYFTGTTPLSKTGAHLSDSKLSDRREARNRFDGTEITLPIVPENYRVTAPDLTDQLQNNTVYVIRSTPPIYIKLDERNIYIGNIRTAESTNKYFTLNTHSSDTSDTRLIDTKMSDVEDYSFPITSTLYNTAGYFNKLEKIESTQYPRQSTVPKTNEYIISDQTRPANYNHQNIGQSIGYATATNQFNTLLNKTLSQETYMPSEEKKISFINLTAHSKQLTELKEPHLSEVLSNSVTAALRPTFTPFLLDEVITEHKEEIIRVPGSVEEYLTTIPPVNENLTVPNHMEIPGGIQDLKTEITLTAVTDSINSFSTLSMANENIITKRNTKPNDIDDLTLTLGKKPETDGGAMLFNVPPLAFHVTDLKLELVPTYSNNKPQIIPKLHGKFNISVNMESPHTSIKGSKNRNNTSNVLNKAFTDESLHRSATSLINVTDGLNVNKSYSEINKSSENADRNKTDNYLANLVISKVFLSNNMTSDSRSQTINYLMTQNGTHINDRKNEDIGRTYKNNEFSTEAIENNTELDRYTKNDIKQQATIFTLLQSNTNRNTILRTSPTQPDQYSATDSNKYNMNTSAINNVGDSINQVKLNYDSNYSGYMEIYNDSKVLQWDKMNNINLRQSSDTPKFGNKKSNLSNKLTHLFKSRRYGEESTNLLPKPKKILIDKLENKLMDSNSSANSAQITKTIVSTNVKPNLNGTNINKTLESHFNDKEFSNIKSFINDTKIKSYLTTVTSKLVHTIDTITVTKTGSSSESVKANQVNPSLVNTYEKMIILNPAYKSNSKLAPIISSSLNNIDLTTVTRTDPPELITLTQNETLFGHEKSSEHKPEGIIKGIPDMITNISQLLRSKDVTNKTDSSKLNSNLLSVILEPFQDVNITITTNKGNLLEQSILNGNKTLFVHKYDKTNKQFPADPEKSTTQTNASTLKITELKQYTITPVSLNIVFTVDKINKKKGNSKRKNAESQLKKTTKFVEELSAVSEFKSNTEGTSSKKLQGEIEKASIISKFKNNSDIRKVYHTGTLTELSTKRDFDLDFVSRNTNKLTLFNLNVRHTTKSHDDQTKDKNKHISELLNRLNSKPKLLDPLYMKNEYNIGHKVIGKMDINLDPKVKYETFSLNQQIHVTSKLSSKTTRKIKYNTYRPLTEEELDPIEFHKIKSALPKHNTKPIKTKNPQQVKNYHAPSEIKSNAKQDSRNKSSIFDPFNKKNLYPVKKTISAPRKIIKRLKLANKRNDIVTMNTADFISRRLGVTKKDKMGEILKLYPKPVLKLRLVATKPKSVILRPKFSSLNTFTKKPAIKKPVILQNLDIDYYRSLAASQHRRSGVIRSTPRNKIHKKPVVPTRVGFGDPVIDTPYYIPTVMKPKFLRDRVNSIRSYIYNAEKPGYRRHFLNHPGDHNDADDSYVQYSKGNSRDEEDTDMPVHRVYDYWIEDMYLKVRLPLPINSNPGMVFPRRHFAKVDEVADLAALFIDDLLDYKEMLDRGELPLERATSREKGQPLCMEQFYRLLGVCRIPQLNKDRLEFPPMRPEGEQEELVVVACRNYFYPIPVKAADRGRLTPGEIQAQLLLAMVDAAGASAAPRVGLLTALPRDAWARAREQLCTDETNRMNMDLISRALCIVCLDEGEDCGDDADTAALLRAMTGAGAGQQSANRWFDKTVQLIISSDGFVGMCYEHSPAEGVAVVRLAERALARAAVAARPAPPPALLPAPVAMRWTLTKEVERAVEQAAKEIDRNIADLDTRVWTYKGYGRDFMKSCRTSPDVYIQLAMQYAYYKMYGSLCSTYESASLRRFRQGRVDNIRSAHAQARAWAAAMCADETPPPSDADDNQKKEKKKLELFDEAAKKQTAIMEVNIQGRGIDNHLIGLRETAREILGQLPEFFTDPTYKQMHEFRLSTSQVATTTEGTFMGYGAVIPDGYGCCYNPKKDSVIFCISSFVSSSVTSTEAFRQSLEEALDSMKLMFENRQAE